MSEAYDCRVGGYRNPARRRQPRRRAPAIEAFKVAKVRNRLHLAMDGVEAMALLTGTGEHRIPLPDRILLDIDLPRKDGRDVLDEIKLDDRLRHIPVVILTTPQPRWM